MSDFTLGQSLDDASIEELQDWVSELKEEILRLQQAVVQKKSDQDKANAIFNT